MAISLEQDIGTEPATIVEGDFLTVRSEDPLLRIHFQLDAIDGIGRDVLEGYKSLPRRGVEVGGLLLGHSRSFTDEGSGESGTEIRIERFQRIECAHKFGPQYVLDEEDRVKLEEAAARVAGNGDVSVLGAYRSHTRPGFQLEDSDTDFANRYFSDPSDLVLLIKPESMSELQAQFYAQGKGQTGDAAEKLMPAGNSFAFRGRILSLMAGAEPESREEEGAPVAAMTSSGDENGDEPDDEEKEPTGRRPALRGETQGESRQSDSSQSRAPRLVPDFTPAGDAPNPRPMFNAPAFYGYEARGHEARGYEARGHEARGYEAEISEKSEEPENSGGFRRWWPLAGALALIAGALAILFWPEANLRNAASFGGGSEPAKPGVAKAPFRPLGLYVESGSGAEQNWRVTWNQTATPLLNARTVGLFLREGDEQNRIDLAPGDLKSGTYEYKPKGNDVTFRLEILDANGTVSAESFRVIRTLPSPSTSPISNTPTPNTPTSNTPAATKSIPGRLVPPRALQRVPPVVPASIRPRVKGAIPIDVRVKVDARGRVTSAIPVGRHSGLQAYLAERAVAAAKQWRFIPAKQDGTAVPGTQTIHFVFDK